MVLHPSRVNPEQPADGEGLANVLNSMDESFMSCRKPAVSWQGQ